MHGHTQVSQNKVAYCNLLSQPEAKLRGKKAAQRRRKETQTNISEKIIIRTQCEKLEIKIIIDDMI